MKYAPIIMFVYNRIDHFEKTYEALSKCPEAKDSILYIFSDGAKNEVNIGKVNQVREAVRKKMNSGDFKEIILTESPVNKGLAMSIINGVTNIINKHGKVIVIEDDCIASPYLLNFLNKSLNYFENDISVGAIAGYSPNIIFPDQYNQDIFGTYRSCSCCWATWINRWENIDWELENFHKFALNKENIKKFNATGRDRFIRLYRQTKGKGDSWSVRFGAHLVANNMITIYPRYSYIGNIGCDESGVHSKSEDAEKMRVDLSKAIAEPKLEDVKLNKDIQKIFKKHYSAGVMSDIKRFLATKAIVFKEKRKKSV